MQSYPYIVKRMSCKENLLYCSSLALAPETLVAKKLNQIIFLSSQSESIFLQSWKCVTTGGVIQLLDFSQLEISYRLADIWGITPRTRDVIHYATVALFVDLSLQVRVRVFAVWSLEPIFQKLKSAL